MSRYRKALLDAEQLIVEAVLGDTYWSCGLSNEEAIKTEMRHWPGKNIMSKLHMELRDIILRQGSELPGGIQDV